VPRASKQVKKAISQPTSDSDDVPKTTKPVKRGVAGTSSSSDGVGRAAARRLAVADSDSD
jgi:hypothetical protein